MSVSENDDPARWAAFLGATNLEHLAAARTLLGKVPGFLYLPVFAPNEVTGQMAQDYLKQNLQPEPSVVDWPKVESKATVIAPTPETEAAQVARALPELLQFLDCAIARQQSGGSLVLNACRSDRYALAEILIPLLNQRRESLRQRGLRLILIWPVDNTLRQRLIEGAPDLWSMRSASPMLEALAIPSRENFEIASKTTPVVGLTTSQHKQITRWQNSHDTRQADLSWADALALLSALFDAKQWQLLAQLAERLHGELSQEQPSPTALQTTAIQAQVMNHLAVSKAKLGDRPAGLHWAKPVTEIYQQLAQENFAAYAPALAASLNNLSNLLAESGDRAAGLTAIRRAVEIYQQLAQENFAAYAPALATSLNNLSNLLAESGDRATGLTAIRRAVEIDQQLAQENFAAYAPALATSLNNLSNPPSRKRRPRSRFNGHPPCGGNS